MASPKKHSKPTPQLPFSVWLALGLLTVVTSCLWWPSLNAEFVFDSNAQVLNGDFVHQRQNLIPVLTFQVMGWDVLDFNRPVQLASLMIDSLIWERNPFGYHLTNLLLHLLATGLTFLLIRHILGLGHSGHDDNWRNFAAFLATLLFAVHPVHAEAVCEPSNRKDILAAVFGLTALLVVSRHDPARPRGDALRIVLGTLLTLLAIGTKEVGVAIPVMLFLYWILFRRKEPWKFWGMVVGGSVAVSVAFLVARFALETKNSEIFIYPPQYLGGSLGQALLIQPSIFALYLQSVFWPLDLCADYNGYSVRYLPLPVALALCIPVALILGWWSYQDRRALFATGIIVAALLPVCNLVPIYHPAADRYLYIPLIGGALLVALILNQRWISQKSAGRSLATFAVIVAACLLSQITLQREQVWSSPLALWKDTLEHNPQSFNGTLGYPEALLAAGEDDESKRQYEIALKTPYGQWAWLWAGYAIILERTGDHAKAQETARHALALKPDMADLEKMERTMQADRHFLEEFSRLVATLPSTAQKNPENSRQNTPSEPILQKKP